MPLPTLFRLPTYPHPTTHPNTHIHTYATTPHTHTQPPIQIHIFTHMPLPAPYLLCIFTHIPLEFHCQPLLPQPPYLLCISHQNSTVSLSFSLRFYTSMVFLFSKQLNTLEKSQLNLKKSLNKSTRIIIIPVSH